MKFKIRQKSRKAQTEILGLVVIVLIIVAGLALYIRFSLMGAKESVKRTYTTSTLASNTINVLLKTTTPCKDATVQELLKDCATDKRIMCGAYGATGQQDSCKYSEAMAKDILNQTFGGWFETYTFAYFKNDNTQVFKVGNGEEICNRSENIKAEFAYIPLNPGTATVKIQLCE